MARFVFLDPRSADFFLDWDAVADDTAASLRIEAGQSPNDWRLSDLVANSLGELALTGDALQISGEDLALVVYTAPLGSPAQEKLDFLTRWAGEPGGVEDPKMPTAHISGD